jgi:stage V sporulation protein SpoVS
MGILKVSARSRSTAVAGAIAGVVRESGRAEAQAIGAGAVNQAVKAVAIARRYLALDGIDVICIPVFTEVEIEGQEHLHTTASDGQFSPSELVAMALERDLLVIAITDHDTTAGLAEALEAARGTGLEVIPGVEISCNVPHEEVHLLGYYFDHHHPALQGKLRAMRDARLQRAKGMVARLTSLGLPLPWEMVAELAGDGSVGTSGAMAPPTWSATSSVLQTLCL